MPMGEKEWIQDCVRYHGRELTGKYRHWCADWDQLPIDETCAEFEVCTCVENTEEVERIKNEHRAARDRARRR